ncbi:hypothetical protein K501DRAFT_272353 [Backusella circina FSU 941]|nr:hypothetical protein K501DRAFT_272353 [Backusella circina FSU 941]
MPSLTTSPHCSVHPMRWRSTFKDNLRAPIMGRPQQEQEEPAFITLPRPFTTNPGDIDVDCGYQRFQVSLKKNQRKKTTKQGKKVQELERKLSEEASIQKAIDTEDIEHAYKKQVESRDELQDLYYSRKRVKEIKRKEMLTKSLIANAQVRLRFIDRYSNARNYRFTRVGYSSCLHHRRVKSYDPRHV